MIAMSKPVLADVLELSVPERIQLVEDIGDSIGKIPEPLGVTQDQREELDRRLEDYRQCPEEGTPWEEVKQRVLASR